MLYEAYWIILDGKKTKKMSFRNFHFLVAEGRRPH